MTAFYITGLEVFDEQSLKAVIRAEDVCWHVDVRDSIHTPDSWAELAADIGRAMQFAHDHNEAQDATKEAP
ncbi:MAG TPA: hypothetical protein VGE36_00920 [Roseateles sp.]